MSPRWAQPSQAPRFPHAHRMAFFLEDVMACTKRLLEWIAGWLPRHCIGAILVSLPALAVYSHVTSKFETDIHVSKGLGTCCLRPSGSLITVFFKEAFRLRSAV